MFIALFPSNTMLSKVKGRISLNKFVVLTASSWKHQALYPWHVSYCSSDSFDRNKELGFYNKPNVDKALPSLPLLTSSSFSPRLLQRFPTSISFVQHRDFKPSRKEEKSSKTPVWKTFLLPHEKILPNSTGQLPADAIEILQKIYLQNQEVAKRKRVWRWFFIILSSIVLYTLWEKINQFSGAARVPVNDPNVSTTFDDVKGVEEAKRDLATIVDFLKNKEKYERIGAKLPSGVLLVGPPGTGKTLLARAVAGEAGVPFFYACGSQFDEGLVGDGARKVRELFSVARENAPCVIFLDEFDSVGGKRSTSRLHPYANQTINQLLAEMDGFKKNDGVIVLAATNRAADLDRALTRPGRFDINVQVTPPREEARLDLIKHYLDKIVYKDIQVDHLAKKTQGFTGATIANMINMAAIIAAVDNSKYVTMTHLFEAYDRITLGNAWIRPGKNIKDKLRTTAYHEGGHTLVSHFSKHCQPVEKVTIQPRGSAQGHTRLIPKEGNLTKAELSAAIDMCMGGRAAEELIYGTDGISSGCSDDLKRATQLAMSMVRLYGMTGVNLSLDKDDYSQFSDETRKIIDLEINRVLQESTDRARALLNQHKDDLEKLVENLLKYETLSAEDLRNILGPPASMLSEANVQKQPESRDMTHFAVPDNRLGS